jgi:hypothetical protein
VGKALDTERRRLIIDGDLKIPVDGSGPIVAVRVFVFPKREREMDRPGFTAAVSVLATEGGTGLTGAVLEGLAKGLRSSSGYDSDASRMTCWQRTPPSLHLTATGESLARRPLTGTIGEVGVSPLSGIVILSEDSEDGEQFNDGNDGLRGDAVNVSDTERRRHGGETSSAETCGRESSSTREGDAGRSDERGRDVCGFAATGDASESDALEGEERGRGAG